MTSSTAVLFPGQGSQAPGMGHEWKGRPEWAVVTRAEDAIGKSLGQLLLDDPLATTDAAQMAVLLQSLMIWESRERPTAIAAFAGHSLGQVTAVIAAGVLSFEDGVRFAAHRATVTQEAAVARPGTMAALVGASAELADSAVATAATECWVANDNAPGQIVIAGTEAGVACASEAAKDLGVKRVTKLDVAAAFHTPLMAEAGAALEAATTGLRLTEPTAPVVSNEDAIAYGDADGWRARLAGHVVRPVRWRESMLTIAALGATSFVEIGPGATLTALAKRCTPELAVAQQ